MLKKNHSLFGYKRWKNGKGIVNFVGLIDAGNPVELAKDM